MKTLFILMSLLSCPLYSATQSMDRHPERNVVKESSTVRMDQNKDFLISSFESELAQLDRAIARLEAQREREPFDSPRYIDLDKNLSDLYLRMNIARKELAQLKIRGSDVSEKERNELELLLSDIRDIIDWNMQPSE